MFSRRISEYHTKHFLIDDVKKQNVSISTGTLTLQNKTFSQLNRDNRRKTFISLSFSDQTDVSCSTFQNKTGY